MTCRNSIYKSAGAPSVSLGEAPHGEKFGELWRYRVVDWRIICQIQDAKRIALRVGDRREVYEG